MIANTTTPVQAKCNIALEIASNKVQKKTAKTAFVAFVLSSTTLDWHSLGQ